MKRNNHGFTTAEANQIADNIRALFGQERRFHLEAWEVEDLQQSRQHCLQRGIAAVYDTYYGDGAIRFCTMPLTLNRVNAHDIIDVLPDAWSDWKIIDNGVFVYAEPATTALFEEGATPYDPKTYIQALHAELDACIPEDISKASIALYQLGFKSMAESGMSGMEEDYIQALDIEHSKVRLGEVDNTVIVETPGKPGHSSHVTTFFSNGRIQPQYQYGASGIPKAQMRFLARYIATQRQKKNN